METSGFCHRLNVNQIKFKVSIDHGPVLIFYRALVKLSISWGNRAVGFQEKILRGKTGKSEKIKSRSLDSGSPWGIPGLRGWLPSDTLWQGNQSPSLYQLLGCAWDSFKPFFIHHSVRNHRPRSLFSKSRKTDVFAYFSLPHARMLTEFSLGSELDFFFFLLTFKTNLGRGLILWTKAGRWASQTGECSILDSNENVQDSEGRESWKAREEGVDSLSPKGSTCIIPRPAMWGASWRTGWESEHCLFLRGNHGILAGKTVWLWKSCVDWTYARLLGEAQATRCPCIL